MNKYKRLALVHQHFLLNNRQQHNSVSFSGLFYESTDANVRSADKKNCVDATPFVRFCKPWVHGVQPFEDTIRLFVVDAVVLV